MKLPLAVYCLNISAEELIKDGFWRQAERLDTEDNDTTSEASDDTNWDLAEVDQEPSIKLNILGDLSYPPTPVEVNELPAPVNSELCHPFTTWAGAVPEDTKCSAHEQKQQRLVTHPGM